MCSLQEQGTVACRLVLLTLFGSNFLDALAAYYSPLFSFVLLHGLLYVVEACLRAVVKTNWLLLVHHFCWVLLLVIATDARSVFSVRSLCHGMRA